MTSRKYYADAELPSLPYHWFDGAGNIINFAAGWTFHLEFLTKRSERLIYTKSAGITGAATLPNVTVNWASGELASIPPDVYKTRLTATRVADGFGRIFMKDSLPEIHILPIPVP